MCVRVCVRVRECVRVCVGVSVGVECAEMVGVCVSCAVGECVTGAVWLAVGEREEKREGEALRLSGVSLGVWCAVQLADAVSAGVSLRVGERVRCGECVRVRVALADGHRDGRRQRRGVRRVGRVGAHWRVRRKPRRSARLRRRHGFANVL